MQEQYRLYLPRDGGSPKQKHQGIPKTRHHPLAIHRQRMADNFYLIWQLDGKGHLPGREIVAAGIRAGGMLGTQNFARPRIGRFSVSCGITRPGTYAQGSGDGPGGSVGTTLPSTPGGDPKKKARPLQDHRSTSKGCI